MSWLDDLLAGRVLPVVQAPMAGASDTRLAAAVSDAGALGTISVAYGATAESVRTACGELGERPFGVGLLNWQQLDLPGVLEAVLEHRPSLVSLSFGDPEEPVRRARAADASVLLAVQVGTVEEARRALGCGIDLLVARGSEGGGHGRGVVATLPLLQQVLEVAGDTPVLAAGGVATGRGLAAVLAAGAVGAWVGTGFTVCTESPFAPELKAAVIAAGADETIYSSVFDRALRLGWPPDHGGRALRNEVTDKWEGRVDELVASLAAGDPYGVTERVTAARQRNDPSEAPVYAGQAVGLLEQERSVAELIAELATYRDHLSRAVGRLGS